MRDSKPDARRTKYKRVVLKLNPELAPIKAAILPLARNKPEIVGMAKAIKRSLQPVLRAVYDDTGGIGKLYARQDEIGTPYCVTVDHQSLEDEAVTVRDRDTWEQERVKVADLQEHLLRRLANARAEQMASGEQVVNNQP
jgi:glycyl-tRNA synthetase